MTGALQQSMESETPSVDVRLLPVQHKVISMSSINMIPDHLDQESATRGCPCSAFVFSCLDKDFDAPALLPCPNPEERPPDMTGLVCPRWVQCRPGSIQERLTCLFWKRAVSPE